MHRRWRVRHSYPQPVVGLAQSLMRLRGVRELSGLLDIPMSVMYRWRARKNNSGVQGGDGRLDARALAELVSHCNEFGFRFAERLSVVSDRTTPVRNESVKVLPYEQAPESEPASAKIAHRTCDSAVPADACAQQRYVFDARRARSSRGVKQRLDAARQQIDAEYFLEQDCSTLADTAQMSRDHFIRMFSDVFGMSPYRYLTLVRIEAAKRLLLCSREPIEVIAVGVGFKSGPSMNRAFKQVEGVSVSNFCKSTYRNRSCGDKQLSKFSDLRR